MNKTGVY